MSEQWPNKTIIGLTGNIATGKTAVLDFAAEKGALTLDADKIVHRIMDEDPSMQAAIAVAFGPEVRRADGRIDRARLASIVFGDDEALRDLELMVHPAVRQEIVRQVQASEAEVVMIEAIKLLEGELVEMCDEVWVTRCPRHVQIQRLMVCRGLDDETAAVRVNAQNPQEAKVARADVVIDTEGTMADTRQQFERAWARLERGERPARTEAAPGAETEQRQEKVDEAEGSVREAEAAQQETAAVVGKATPEVASAVTVRRARPSDIPGILLLMHKATGGRVRKTRAEMLRSFGERSYLIGQTGAQINTVVGWNTDSTTAVCIEQIYAHPLPAAKETAPAVFEEIERSARELICEVALAFLPQDAPEAIRRLLADAGYESMEKGEMRRAWQQTVEERQPENTDIMGKVLRDIRVG
ncbi:MAG: dephospho-CoA kinase [Chloroflexota bacterium]